MILQHALLILSREQKFEVNYLSTFQNTKECVCQIARFLGYDFDDAALDNVCRQCHISEMQKNPRTNYSWWDGLGLRKKNSTRFLRKGGFTIQIPKSSVVIQLVVVILLQILAHVTTAQLSCHVQNCVAIAYSEIWIKTNWNSHWNRKVVSEIGPWPPSRGPYV